MKKDFIEKIFQIVSQSFETSDKSTKSTICKNFAIDDYNNYIEGIMIEDRIPEFEDHCLTCATCQYGIVNSHQKYIKKIDLSENEFLFRKTLDLLDTIDQQTSKNILDVVVNVAKGFIDIVKTTGEILTGPIPIVVRGTEKHSTKAKSVKILKELDSPAISVQLSLLKQELENDIMMIISFFNQDSNEFISGVEMELNDNGKKINMISDKNGEASITVNTPCNWIIYCEILNEKIIQLNVKIGER